MLEWLLISAFTEFDPIWPIHQFNNVSTLTFFKEPSDNGKGETVYFSRISFEIKHYEIDHQLRPVCPKPDKVLKDMTCCPVQCPFWPWLMQSHRNCQISLNKTEVSISITFLTNEILQLNEITIICHLTKSTGSLKNIWVDSPLNSSARLVELPYSGDRLGELLNSEN